MLSRSLCMLALLGCQSKREAPPPAPETAIQVRDASGVLVAEVRPLRPCRGTVGPVELIVGGPPLLATYGSTQWTGSAGTNGTMLLRDGQPVARVYPAGDAKTAAVLDPHGVALARVVATGKSAIISNAASVPVRNLQLAGDTITADAPKLTISGTQDLVLAALLSAPELAPEVRILAACERVLVKDK